MLFRSLFALEAIVTFALAALAGYSVSIPTFVFLVVLRLVSLTLWFYTGALLIYAVLSWFGDREATPLSSVLTEIVEPVLRPVRRILPPVSGFDLSPLLVMLVCQAGIIALALPSFLR